MKYYLGLLLTLVLVGAGCAPATTSVKTTTPAQSESDTQEQQDVQVDTNDQFVLMDGLYQLDVASSSLKWQASKVKFTHNGSVTAREGFLRVENGATTEASVLVDMNTIKNFDQEGKFLTILENHLRSADFFDVTQYSTASFVVKKVEPLAGISGRNFRVDGELTIKNITKPASFSAEVKEMAGTLRVIGKLSVDRTEYDIKYGSGKFFENLGDSLIDDIFYLDLDLRFNKAEEEPGEAAEDDIQGS